MPAAGPSTMPARPKWRNWQTRRTQNPVPERACGFDSHLRHFSRDAPGGQSALERLGFDQVDAPAECLVAEQFKEDAIAFPLVGDRDPEVIAAPIGAALGSDGHGRGAILAGNDCPHRASAIDLEERPGHRELFAAVAAGFEVEADFGSDRVLLLGGRGEGRAVTDQMVAEADAWEDGCG